MSNTPATKSRRYSMKDVPRSQIDFIVGNFHVGTPDEEVAADIRERAESAGWPKPVVTLAVNYAVKRHQANRGTYSDVMSGNIGRKRRMSREDGHASGSDEADGGPWGREGALTDRYSHMPPNYERYFYTVKHALMARYGFSAEQADTMLARPRTKTWVRASFRATRSPGLMAADLAKVDEDRGNKSAKRGSRRGSKSGYSAGRQKLTYTPDPYPHAPDTTRDAPDTERSPEPSFGRPMRHKLTYTPNPHPQHAPPARQKLTYTPPGHSTGKKSQSRRTQRALERDLFGPAPAAARRNTRPRPTATPRPALTQTPGDCAFCGNVCSPVQEWQCPHCSVVYPPAGHAVGSTDDGLYVVQAISGGRVVMSDSFDKRKDADAAAREWLAFRGAEYTSVRIITRDGDLVSNHRVGDKRRKSR